MQDSPVQVGTAAAARAVGRTHAADFLSYDVCAARSAPLSATTEGGAATFPNLYPSDSTHFTTLSVTIATASA
ncbi:hypothetical protein GCM10022233_54300 [Streptomyces shaanxiensis]|uniref:Uncharacterized protein n=1 Tax=Streptomyces shaanxiensis TaxID=653357 RepID=A0ABP7VPJ9_9ACTN